LNLPILSKTALFHSSAMSYQSRGYGGGGQTRYPAAQSGYGGGAPRGNYNSNNNNSSYSSGGYAGNKRGPGGAHGGGSSKRGRSSYGRGGRQNNRNKDKHFVELKPAGFLLATSIFDIPEPVVVSEDKKTEEEAAATTDDAEMTDATPQTEAEETANGDEAAVEVKAEESAELVLPTEASKAAELLSGDILHSKSTAVMRLGKDNKYKLNFEVRDSVHKGPQGRFELFLQQSSIANITAIDLEQQRNDAKKAEAEAAAAAEKAALAAANGEHAEIDPSKMKVADLKKALTERALDTEGLKAQLIERLTAYQEEKAAVGEGEKLWNELHGLDEELSKDDYHSDEAGWDVPALEDDIAILKKQAGAVEEAEPVEEPLDTENVVYRVVIQLKSAPKVMTRNSTYWSTEKAAQVRVIVLDFKRGNKNQRLQGNDPKVAFGNATSKGALKDFVAGSGAKACLEWPSEGDFSIESTVQRLAADNQEQQKVAQEARDAKDKAEAEEKERIRLELLAKKQAEEARQNTVVFPSGELKSEELSQNVQSLLSETVRVWHQNFVSKNGVLRKDVEKNGKFVEHHDFSRGLLEAALLSQAATIQSLQSRVEKLENDKMQD